MTLTFFDTVGQFNLNFVCPFFAVTGFSIAGIALDVMHVMDLGVTQWLVAAAIWAFLDNNYCGSDHKQAEGRQQDNLVYVRRAIKDSALPRCARARATAYNPATR